MQDSQDESFISASKSVLCLQEYIQFTGDQLARLAEMGMALFAQLRSLNAGSRYEVGGGPLLG